ncbi:hypothetical protein HD554DRAFT_1266385 [Boletus coccyginus]|nr:hypothetical protein HD554DRAFT_1266385 [Boletus coccyginus]
MPSGMPSTRTSQNELRASLHQSWPNGERSGQRRSRTEAAGFHFESRQYHATFALADHGEGFDAFLQKRGPQWAHK